ncbi:S41 family peptidase [Candidatus Saccharibacteria bacterium]|nr:S41 family peptidase [Candidatus Saccharibacteria bacterium]
MNDPQLTNDTPVSHIKKSRNPIWQMAVIAVAFFVIGFMFNAAGAHVQIGPNTQSKTAIDLTKFWQINDILHKKFDGDISTDKQSEGAIVGMVASLGDPYTTYLTEKANKELANQLSGKLSGIGIEMGIKNNKLTVIAPIDGTPAAKAGLRAGDLIIGVDGQDTSNMTIDEAVTKIRGDKGTEVKLNIIHPGGSPQVIAITREDIKVPSVTSEIKLGNIGYIKIRTFGAETAADVSKAAGEFAAQGVKAVIVDVRDDPGGYLDGAVKISSEFVSSGTIVEERSRTGQNKVLTALSGGQLTKVPVIMLVNGGSASASEIMAGALHDNGRATLVGEKTFGKGSVQEVICLSGLNLGSDCKGDSLKVTVAHWYTPKGINISKEGIKPDIEVKLTSEDYNTNRDPQLIKALELATQKANGQ